MRLVVVGCAGSFPGPDSAASCYLVEADDGTGRTWRVLLDLGNGALGALQNHCDPADVDAVVLSHLHPDHIADLTGLYVYLKYHPSPRSGGAPGTGARSTPVPVHGPVGVADRLAGVYGLEHGESMTDQFAMHELSAEVPVTVGPLQVVPVPVRHPVPAFGFRVTGPSEKDPSRQVTLAYTGDTDECPGLATLADGVQVLLAEAAFLEHRDHTPGIHLSGRRAGAAAARGRVGHLVLTHVPAWNDPADTFAEARSAYRGPIDLAVPGMVVEL